MDGPRGWGAPLHDAVLTAASIGPGRTVLDLGCGTGEFAAAAVARGAVVTGVDADPRAIAIATRDVPGATFRVGDAVEPPPGPFDVVVALQLLGHVRNPVELLRRAATAGLLVAVTVWGRDEECDVTVFGSALERWLGERRRPDGPPPVTEPDRLRQLAGLAGLEDVAVTEVVCPFEYADADEVVGPLFDTAFGRAAINRAGPVAVREAVLDALAHRRLPDGRYRLQNTFRVLTARG
jgi:SAM-dependent methyltransferase